MNEFTFPENGPMPEGKVVARFHIDLDKRNVNDAGYADGYATHIERNGLGRFFVLTVVKLGEE